MAAVLLQNGRNRGLLDLQAAPCLSPLSQKTMQMESMWFAGEINCG